jgi:hypothetical protein
MKKGPLSMSAKKADNSRELSAFLALILRGPFGFGQKKTGRSFEERKQHPV